MVQNLRSHSAWNLLIKGGFLSSTQISSWLLDWKQMGTRRLLTILSLHSKWWLALIEEFTTWLIKPGTASMQLQNQDWMCSGGFRFCSSIFHFHFKYISEPKILNDNLQINYNMKHYANSPSTISVNCRFWDRIIFDPFLIRIVNVNINK